MKDLQILWAACKYHCRRIAKFFKSGLLQDEQGHYYSEGNYQRILAWRAFRSWQRKKIERQMPWCDTDEFEAETNIKMN